MLPPDSSAGSDELLWLTSSLGMSLSNVLPSAETVSGLTIRFASYTDALLTLPSSHLPTIGDLPSLRSFIYASQSLLR